MTYDKRPVAFRVVRPESNPGFSLFHDEALANDEAEMSGGVCQGLYVRDGREAMKARPLSEWHEDDGDVLWWKFPIEEPPYCGSPLDLGQTVEVTLRGYSLDKLMRGMVGGWPGYHTHWTPLPPAPEEPDALPAPSAEYREMLDASDLRET